MRIQWQQRRFQWQTRPLDWRERAVLAMLAIAAIPVALVLLSGLFLLAVGFGVVALATWLVARFFWSRRGRPPYPPVIGTDYVRVREEPDDQPVGRNPWTRP